MAGGVKVKRSKMNISENGVKDDIRMIHRGAIVVRLSWRDETGDDQTLMVHLQDRNGEWLIGRSPPPPISPAYPAPSLYKSQLYPTMDAAALNNLTPDQVNAVKAQAQQQANMSVTQALMKSMAELCFHKCAGSSVRNVDSPQEKSQMVLCLLSELKQTHRAIDWTIGSKHAWHRARTLTLSFGLRSQRHWKRGKIQCKMKVGK